jgi:Tfp pilus assembly protein PilF
MQVASRVLLSVFSVLTLACSQPEPKPQAREDSQPEGTPEVTSESTPEPAKDPKRARIDSINSINDAVKAFNAGDMAAAEQAFLKAVEADPTYADAHYNLGRFYKKQKNWTEAEKAFRAAVDNMGDAPNEEYRTALAEAEAKLAEGN